MRKKRLGLLITVPFMLFMAVFAFGLTTHNAYAVNNGLALTPPMGWNNYNHFGCDVGASTIEQQANAMVSSGLAAAGYQYINIDDCWSEKSRDSNGNLVPDPTKYPNGISAVANYVHGLGLKLGLYTDAGTETCSGYPGMYGHEQQDADTYASWGVDYLKVDWCSSTGIDAQTEYTKIGNALRSSGRAIVFSLCDWGQSNVASWGPSVGNLWRTTGDISDNWTSMLSNFDSNAADASSAGPGGWNDPDMLEVGNGGMSTTEDQTHFSLWAISAAPLIMGNDMTSMSASAKSILTNSDVIAVDQDSRGVQGTKVADNGSGLQVWAKPLSGTGNVAVVLLNRNTSASNITVNWSNIGISGSASVRDLWSHTNVGSFNGSYTANVAGHGVVMLKISTSGSGTTPTPTPTAGSGGGSSYEAESSANTLAGGAVADACSACSGGEKVGYVGLGGTLQFNNVQASSSGTYTLTIYYVDGDTGRSALMSVNGAAASTLTFNGTNDSNWNVVQSLTVSVPLNAGTNTILFSNPSGPAPDFDRITVAGTSTGSTPTPTPTNTPTPAPTTTPAPTPTNTPTPAPTSTSGSSCKVSYVIQNQWPGGFTNSTTITNTGSSAISSWTLKFSFPGSQQVTEGWDGTFSQSGSQVTITNMSYNGTIASGASLSLGFNGTWTTSNPNPTTFTLNGVTCSTS